ncbi:MAG: hypothetical protein V2I97_21730 [Desulfococcaceae bacterium]|jgi:hypothetical protein|nr:hypothetical protein [Desulfococcaceae bacterium]
MQTLADESRLRQILKEVLTEVLREQKDIFHDMIVEAIEDIALVNAIREGEGTETVSREEVFSILEKP